ncbi:MAG: hypothetical protein QOI35_3636 [Cryptosporangiaceae bacterium]|nr:hypothetical protein [Cryptosporangiaceae bacterium]
MDTARLERALRANMRGDVGFGTAARALYAADASNYRHVPLGVVQPRTAADAAAAVAICRDHQVPVTPRGGGTSVAGNAIGEGVVLDTSRYLNRVLGLDPVARTAVVEPGVVLDALQREAAPHGLVFGPDPSTHSRCTLGGMIGNNACGAHSVVWGTTSDNVDALDVLRYDGTRLSLPGSTALPGSAALASDLHRLADENLALIRRSLGRFPRQVSGYPLHELLPENGRNLARALVGTEGTCALVLGATVRLAVLPAARVLLVAGFADDSAAAEAALAVLPHGPLTVEGIDAELVQSRSRPGLPPGGAWLFVEVGGESRSDALAKARRIAGELKSTRILEDPQEQRALWRIRQEGAGIATRMPDGAEAWPGWEDAAVPPERLAQYLREFRELKDRHGLRGVTYGHFGEGCIHVRLNFDLLTPGGRDRFRHFTEDAADLVAAHGGSFSGEHGDGQARAELLPRLYGDELVALFGRFKAIWDPENGLNPGVLVDPRPIDADLRVARPPRELLTLFAYPHDGGDFAQATRRCVGVGKCRNASGGVMCPSFQATGEEQHSTRGRARLLFELARGDLVTDGWRSTEVREALDLCLACKACRTECPVNVDMATYKAEFLHHHYRGRLRPRSHYALGYLPLWARAASVAPRLVNKLTSIQRIAYVGKRVAGVARERSIPPFAAAFTRSFRPRASGRPQVVLWPDTFTNYFTPRVGQAAARVLADAGFDVVLPRGSVCCGLTWISTGQLGFARRVARRSLAALPGGLPIVGLEPSCTAALRSDLPELLPEFAAVAARTFTLAEFLTEHAPHWQPPRIDGEALLQTHCHQRSVLTTVPDAGLLARAGVTLRDIEPTCCGMAGNFGFEHYDVAQAVGERVLLPAVRSLPDSVTVLADGFSCRTQISQSAGRRALHLAELLAAGMDPPARG